MEFAVFEEEDEDYISKYISEPPEFTIYLDAPNGLPFGKIEVNYDNNIYSIFV
ncbi:hypothetical protein ACGCUR_01305 [Eubacteriales bacterium KG126]